MPYVLSLKSSRQAVDRDADPFVDGFVQQAKTLGYAKDHFGKRRLFEEKEYLARNFSVQAPASIVCLEKLIALHKAVQGIARVALHIHDEFVLYVPRKAWKEVFRLVRKVLLAESELCPGLKLQVSCEAGRDLDNLKPLGVK